MKYLTYITLFLFVLFACEKTTSETDLSIDTPDIKWISVEGGDFLMGSIDGASNEQPVHSVSLNNFELSKYEITNIQFCDFLNAIQCPSNGEFDEKLYLDISDTDCQINYENNKFNSSVGNENFPVMEVTWHGATAFAQWTNARLPTEAEWEFAACGGNLSHQYLYSGNSDINQIAWHWQNSDLHTHEVGTKNANELGIYDMTGNVWEWCSDWYDENYYATSISNNPTGAAMGERRVLRGGSWHSSTDVNRVYNRLSLLPSDSDLYFGFRIAR